MYRQSQQMTCVLPRRRGITKARCLVVAQVNFDSIYCQSSPWVASRLALLLQRSSHAAILLPVAEQPSTSAECNVTAQRRGFCPLLCICQCTEDANLLLPATATADAIAMLDGVIYKSLTPRPYAPVFLCSSGSTAWRARSPLRRLCTSPALPSWSEISLVPTARPGHFIPTVRRNKMRTCGDEEAVESYGWTTDCLSVEEIWEHLRDAWFTHKASAAGTQRRVRQAKVVPWLLLRS